MPNRIIKESITTSDTLAQISADAERLFWRLVVLADDYGLYDGRPTTILGKGFTAFLGTVKPKDITAWLAELEAAQLLRCYSVDGKPYIQITTWERHQQTRAKKSKYPQPSASDASPMPLLASDCKGNQMPADTNKCLGNGNGNVIENGNEERSANAPVSLPAPDSVREVFDYYRLKIQPNARYIEEARRKIKTRLKTFSPAQLKDGIDRFAADPWRMENNSNEGAAWFFDSDTRSEKFLNLVPRASPSNGQQPKPEGKSFKTWEEVERERAARA